MVQVRRVNMSEIDPASRTKLSDALATMMAANADVKPEARDTRSSLIKYREAIYKSQEQDRRKLEIVDAAIQLLDEAPAALQLVRLLDSLADVKDEE